MKKFVIMLFLFSNLNSFAQRSWESYGLQVYTETKDSITLNGLKNADGQIVVSPKYNVIMTPLKGGYAYLANTVDKKLRDNKILELGKNNALKILMGLIDSTGKVAIEPTQYDVVAYYPNDNFVSVVKGEKQGVYSLLTKRIEVPIEFDRIYLYNKVLPLITVKKLQKFGIYNIDLHKLVVPCQYDREPYTQYVNTENKTRKVIGYIVDYSDPIRSGYLDALGNVLIELKYHQIAPEYFGSDYMLGILRFKPDNSNNYTCRYFFHYYKNNTIKISNLECTEMGIGYSTPNALVNINGKWGLFNCLTEQYILEPQFEKVNDNSISGKSIIAYKNKKATLYDFSGKEMNFDIIKECETKDYQEYYSVCKNKKWGCLDYDLNYLIPLEYDREVLLSDQMWVVKNGKWGCIDKNLVTSFAFVYDTLVFSDFKILEPGKYYSCIVNGEKIDFDGNRHCWIIKNDKEISINNLTDAIINADMPSVDYQLMTSYKTERTDAFRYIIGSYNCYDSNYKFYQEAFKKLINADIDFNFSNDIGNFLHNMALSASRYPLKCSWEIEELVKKGVDPNQLKNGRTALMFYLYQTRNIQFEIVEAFLKAGSKVSITDGEGNDALDLAKKAPGEVKKILKEYRDKEK